MLKLVRLVVLVIASCAAGCMSIHESKDFERHRNSQLTTPFDRDDVIFFDVSFTAQYPDGDPAAEALRLEWLAQWLDQRSMCGDGFEIVERRPFEFLEHNPARHDVRYEVKCTAPANDG